MAKQSTTSGFPSTKIRRLFKIIVEGNTVISHVKCRLKIFEFGYQ